MTPAIGDRVAYRSIAGETWDAKVLDVHTAKGFAIWLVLVDVDVFHPSTGLVMHSLKGVRWLSDPSDPMPGARPKANDRT